MIDIRQLHIGAHVEYEGRCARIEQITTIHLESKPMEVLLRRSDDLAFVAPLDNINPIQITPGLLTELGFGYHEDSDCWRKYEKSDNGNINWGIIATEYALSGCQGYWKVMIRPADHRLCSDVFCKYLHELESYAALNGAELIND